MKDVDCSSAQCTTPDAAPPATATENYDPQRCQASLGTVTPPATATTATTVTTDSMGSLGTSRATSFETHSSATPLKAPALRLAKRPATVGSHHHPAPPAPRAPTSGAGSHAASGHASTVASRRPSRSPHRGVVRSRPESTVTSHRPSPVQPPAESLETRLTAKFADALRSVEAGIDGADETLEHAKDVAHAVVALGGQGAMEKAKTLLEYLKDPLNEGLRQRVRSGEVSGAALVAMGDDELMNPEVARETAEIKTTGSRQRNVQDIVNEAALRTDLYACPACGKRNCTMTQQEKAKPWFSGGEDTLDVLCSCLECGHGFRPGST